MSQGLLVTDTKGRVVYANKAYGEMTGASSAADIKTVENLLSDVPEASSTIYRLASGLRDGIAGRRRVQALPGHPSGRRTRCALVPGAVARLQCAGAAAAVACLAAHTTSRRSAPSRNVSSSTCRRRSTIWTTRRPASSRPTRRAASPTSMRRSPNGWVSILRASRPAPRRCPKSSPATAWRSSAR